MKDTNMTKSKVVIDEKKKEIKLEITIDFLQIVSPKKKKMIQPAFPISEDEMEKLKQEIKKLCEIEIKKRFG